MPTPSPTDSGAAGPPPVTRAQRLSLAVSTFMHQLFVMYMTAMMGLGLGRQHLHRRHQAKRARLRRHRYHHRPDPPPALGIDRPPALGNSDSSSASSRGQVNDLGA